MNANYISRALCFHGQPMQKIWEDERGAGDLNQCGVPPHPDYSVYQERQKFFTFQDRAKRLKLHQFFARKANDLYDADLTGAVLDNDKLLESKPYIATLPPYEAFTNKHNDKTQRWRCVLEAIKPGDIVYGIVTKANMLHALIQPLCTAEPLVRYLKDIPIKAYLHTGALPKPAAVDKRGKPRIFAANDIVCCEVLEVSVDADRLTLGIENIFTINKDIHLGVVSMEELPAYYRKYKDNQEKYEEYLRKSREFLNPNYDLLYQVCGINVNDTFTLMTSLKQSFPRAEYAKELRQTQASKWAFRSVAEGIEHFKNGHHVEAFQCLNKALNIDPRNVEGLVARGALFANKGSFLKAVDDFEKALKLNSYHVNARKYMGETLVALGRRYEEENRLQDAVKAYKDCLNIIPNHEQARLSLEAIQQRKGSHYLDGLFNLSGTASETDKAKDAAKRSESSSDDSSSDSSESDTESEQSDTTRGKKEASMSPLSKRMALHAATMEMEESNKQFNQPYYMAANYETAKQPPPSARNPNEFKLEDDDTESRVRKLLMEASKHKKEKNKKSKKKKSKKSKKSGKEKANAADLLGKINFQEAYKAISGLNIENKLTENLQLYEKTIAEIKKRQELLQQTNIENVPHHREETPPPKAPSMRLQDSETYYTTTNTRPPASLYPTYASTSSAAAAAAAAKVEAVPKLSFQIKRPVKVDKFGLVRIATPLTQRSPSRSSRSRSSHSRSHSPSTRKRRHRSSSRSRSRSHSRSRSSLRRRHRSRSSSRGSRHRRDRRSRRSRSRSRSRSRTRSNSRSRSRPRHHRRSSPATSRYNARSGGRRRTPSPFVPRNTPPPRRRQRSRTRWDRNNAASASNQPSKYPNRVWMRNESMNTSSTSGRRSRSPGGRWQHDKFKADAEKVDDGPSIEEIDEIINRAQRERKQEIINRNKDILKKSTF